MTAPVTLRDVGGIDVFVVNVALAESSGMDVTEVFDLLKTYVRDVSQNVAKPQRVDAYVGQLPITMSDAADMVETQIKKFKREFKRCPITVYIGQTNGGDGWFNFFKCKFYGLRLGISVVPLYTAG